MKKLPLWHRPATLPAFHDGESASVIEQTYKLYQAIQELIDEYNAFAEGVNQKIENHESKYNSDMEVFTMSLRQEFQDFIGVIDLKVKALENEIQKAGYFDIDAIYAEMDKLREEINLICETQRLSENVFDKEFAQDKAGYWFANGTPSSSEYTTLYCYSDYIPVNAGDVVNVQAFFNLGYSGSKKLIRYEWLDEEKNYITGENLSGVELSTTPVSYTAPDPAKYIVFTFMTSTIDYVTIAINTTLNEYKEKSEIKMLANFYVDWSKIINPEVRKDDIENLQKEIDTIYVEKEVLPSNFYDYNFAKSTKGSYWNGGKPESNEYTTIYTYTNVIPVKFGEQIHIQSFYGLETGNAEWYGIKVPSYEFMDDDGNVVNKGTTSGLSFEHIIEVPSGATKFVANILMYDGMDNIYETITISTKHLNQFIEYAPNKFTIKDLYIPSKNIIKEENGLLIDLPKQYDLVVGDTFQLFYEGIIKAKEPLNYNILVNCSVGSAYKRYYEYTPNIAGTYNLSIQVSDDLGNVLATAQTTLVVKNEMSQPSSNINVLCVGDSLTAGGVWVEELNRRLSSNDNKALNGDNAPMGKGLSKVNFIGTCLTPSNAGYEGYGGWKFSDYNSTSTSGTNYWVNADHDKTDVDQQSIWQDSNGNTWQLETIVEGMLKFKKHGTGGVMPTSGTLSWAGGGEHHSDIIYNNATLESGNPFVYNGVVNFGAYCNELGIDKIHECFILLGWNSTGVLEEDYKIEVKAFIDKLKAHNPNMKIVLMGLQMPNLDGLGSNYGSTGNLANYTYMQQHVINLNKWYQDVADEYNNVEFMQISGQFDSRNNMPSSTRKVNARNSNVETYGTNGVHPATEGYYQIADAVYRKFNNINQ